MNVLSISAPVFRNLWGHLLPRHTKREQAAFLFCSTNDTNGGVAFDVVDHVFLEPSNFAAQYSDYIELTDETRIALIKRAHKSETALVEMHSHPGPYPAAFSFSDRRGLKETVPHMRWRLKRRPYLAIVVAPSGFDALVWPTGKSQPEPLAGIMVGSKLNEPTNNSLEGWDDVQSF